MEIILAVPLILIALLMLTVIRLQRVLLAHHESVIRAYSALDNLYRLRHDLIPTVMTSLRANTDYDHGLSSELSILRARVVEDRLSRDPMKLEEEIESVLETTMRLAETHPRLLRDSTIQHVRAGLVNLNAQIMQARTNFNRTAESFNLLVVRFPTAPVARQLGLEPRRPLEINTTVKAFEPAFEPMSVSFD